GLNGDLALPALRSTYVVEDPIAAERLAAAYPESHFITRSGEHYHHRLVSGGRGASAGPLALRRDFRIRERRTSDLAAGVRSAEAKSAEVVARVLHLDQELRRLTAANLEVEKKVALSSERLRQLRQELDRASERLGVLRQEAKALGEERESIQAQQTHLRGELESAAEEQTRREQAIVRITGLVREARSRLDHLGGDLIEAQ